MKKSSNVSAKDIEKDRLHHVLYIPAWHPVTLPPEFNCPGVDVAQDKITSHSAR
jgi:hypothetical protein